MNKKMIITYTIFFAILAFCGIIGMYFFKEAKLPIPILIVGIGGLGYLKSISSHIIKE